MDILFEIIIELMVELTIGDLDFPSNNKLSKPVKIIITILLSPIEQNLATVIAQTRWSFHIKCEGNP